jgi:DNA primase
MTLRIIRLPEGRDPDDVIRHSPQQWQALIDEALPVMDFYIQVHTAGRNLHDPQEQRAALDHLLPLVRQLDSTQQRVYVARLEQVIGMRAELILDLLRAAPPPERARKRAAPPPPQQPDTPPPDAAPHQHPALRREEYLLALLFRHPSAVQRIETALAHDLHPFSAVREMLGDTLASVLEQTTNRLIWQAWHEAGTPLLLAEQHTPPDGDPPWIPPDWARALDERLQTHLAHVATHPLPEQPPYRALFDAEQCARQLRREQVRRWQYRLTEQMHHTEDEEENQRLRTLVAELLDFAAQMRTPHRVMFWSDLRDTIGKPDE